MSKTDQGWFPSFQVFVNSAYTKTQYQLNVPRAYSCYLSLVSASFPVSWYNVPAGSNTLSFLYRVTGESTNRTFTMTIPPGWYSSTELANAIAWSGNIAGVLPSSTFSTIGCVYQDNQNKFQFIFQPLAQVQFFALLPGTLASKLGFQSPTYSATYGATFFPSAQAAASTGSGFTDGNYKVALVSVGDQCADLSSVRNIHIQTNFKVKQFAAGTQTLAVIPVTQSFGGVVQYQNQSGSFAAQMYDNIFGDIYVSLTDDSGAAINFNGLPWSLVLQFDIANPDTIPMLNDVTDPYLVESEIPQDNLVEE